MEVFIMVKSALQAYLTLFKRLIVILDGPNSSLIVLYR